MIQKFAKLNIFLEVAGLCLLAQAAIAEQGSKSVCRIESFVERNDKVEMWPDVPGVAHEFRSLQQLKTDGLVVTVKNARYKIIVNGSAYWFRRRYLKFPIGDPCAVKPVCSYASRQQTSGAALGSDSCPD